MSDAVISRQSLKTIMAVGEGIHKLIDIEINGASIADQEIAFCIVKGTANQPYITGLEKVISASTTEFNLVKGDPVNTGITYNVDRTSNNTTASSVDIGFYFPNGLYHQGSNGSRHDESFEAEIYIQMDGGTWNKYEKNFKVTLNSIAPARASIQVTRPAYIPAGTDYAINVKRITAPSDLLGEEGDIHINESKVNFTILENTYESNYPGTACVGIWIEDISLVNNQWPKIGVLNEGMEFYVPNPLHYNSENKTYNDVNPWDGTFDTVAYTNNLSYVIYSFLSDKLIKTLPTNYEKTETIDVMLSVGVPEEDIGIYSFYKFARYCDTPFLGVPRYTVNKQFIDRMEYKDFFDALASIGNAKLVRKHGLICIVWDRKLTSGELNAVPVLTVENTLDGFSESNTDTSERYTNVIVVFEDIANSNTVASVSADSIALVDFLKGINWLPSDTQQNHFVKKYKFSSTTVELLGATSYSTALIKARSLLFDVLWGYRTMSFSGGWELSNLYEGQVIGIIDSAQSNAKISSRVKSFTLNSGLYTLTLSTEVELTPASYVYVYCKNDTLVNLEQLNATDKFASIAPIKVHPHATNFAVGQTSKVSKTWIFYLADEPIVTASLVVANLELRHWTITGIDFSENVFTFRCKEFFNEKFDFVEGTTYEYLPTTQVITSLLPVKNIIPDFYLIPSLTSAQLTCTVSWQHDIPATITTDFTIFYEVTVNVFTSYSKTIKLERQFKTFMAAAQASPGNDIPVLLSHQQQYAFLKDTIVTQTHSTQVDFTIESYLDFFATNSETLTTIIGDVTITIKSYIANLDLGIVTSPVAVYKDTLTLTRPPLVGSDFISSDPNSNIWT